MAFFDRYKACCDEMGVSTHSESLANLWGVSRGSISGWKKNGIAPKQAELVKIADDTKRLDVFKTARAYYKEIDIDMDASGEWAKATDRFLVLKDLHVGANIVNNLKCFYDAYIKEASDRVAENKRRERSYESEVSNAKFEAAEARLKHRAAMPVSGIVALAGLTLFLVIGILLLLFSLQRSVKHLEKIIAEKDKTKE